MLAGGRNWSELTATGAQAAIRRRRRNRGDDVQKRADRALMLVQMGELSAGRLALDGAQVSDGNQATLKALTDTRRRPPVPRAPLLQFVLESQPEVFSLDEGLFVQSLHYEPAEFRTTHVGKLRKALNGTRPAAASWGDELRKGLVSCNLTVGTVSRCCFHNELRSVVIRRNSAFSIVRCVGARMGWSLQQNWGMAGRLLTSWD